MLFWLCMTYVLLSCIPTKEIWKFGVKNNSEYQNYMMNEFCVWENTDNWKIEIILIKQNLCVEVKWTETEAGLNFWPNLRLAVLYSDGAYIEKSLLEGLLEMCCFKLSSAIECSMKSHVLIWKKWAKPITSVINIYVNFI